MITDKRKEQLKNAQSKFKKVATKLNEAEQELFNKRLEELNLNTSQYIKMLIENDRASKVNKLLKVFK